MPPTSSRPAWTCSKSRRSWAATSILITARYTHLSSITGEQASARIDALMARFTLHWAGVR